MVSLRHAPRRRLGPDHALALPRRVEDTSLHGALRENLRSFLEAAERSGRSMPRFVERELRSYLACGIAAHEQVAPERTMKAYSWAQLIRRVFQRDVLECVRCKGRLALIATITQPSVIQRMLVLLGLPARPPPLAPARGPWQEDLDFEGA